MLYELLEEFSVRRSYLFYLAISGTVIGLSAIFVFSVVQFPTFFADSQYYVQSAMLWPRGELTFAASWIGNRDLVVLFYHLIFATFGPSLDALSIGLATILLITNVAIAVTVFSLVNASLVAASLTLAGAFIFATLESANVTSIMKSPASDNLAVMTLACMWALWSIGHDRQWPAALCLLLSLVTGISAHIRAELIVFPTLSALIAIPWPRLLWSTIIMKAGVSLAGFTIGLAIPALFWPLWVGAPKPHAYTGAFLVYYPFDKFARDINGPASKALANQLNLPSGSRIPFWEAIASTYSHLGAKSSDELITRAGLEAAHKNLVRWFTGGFQSALDIVRLPGEISITQENWNEQEAEVAELLGDFDRYRLTTSAQYGNDATTETRALADRHLSLIAIMRSIVPPVQISLVLPGLIGIIAPILVVGLGWKMDWRDTLVLLPLPLYGIFILTLGALTNGSHPRYFAPLVAFDLLVCGIACAKAALSVDHAERGLRQPGHE